MQEKAWQIGYATNRVHLYQVLLCVPKRWKTI